MLHRHTPIALLSTAVLASCLLAAIVLGIAMDQRWMGLRLTTQPNLAFPVTYQGLWIDQVQPGSPAQSWHGTSDQPPLAALVAVIGADGSRLALTPADLLEEPDTLPDYAAMQAFFDRQSAIARITHQRQVTLEIQQPNGGVQQIALTTQRQRPVTSLPFTFWLQIGVGLSGFWIGIWVLSLRRSDWAARMLALAGTGLMVSVFPAAIYSTRELAIPGSLFAVLSQINHLGAILFGIGMLGLFMIYPRPLLRRRWMLVPALVLGAWHLVDVLRLTPGPATGVHLPVVLAMLGIVGLVVAQYRATRGDLVARASLGWLGLSVSVGAGAFVVSTIVPNLLGLPHAVPQGVAFVFFLLIQVGVALGVARYGLFNLQVWSFRILFYAIGVMLLLAVDAILIVTIVDERAPAFAFSLVLIAVLWLPLRERFARWALRRARPAVQGLFRAVIDVALTPPGSDQTRRWQALLQDAFQPLTIQPIPGLARAELLYDGQVLCVPGAGSVVPGYRLEFGNQGRRLFSMVDRDLAADLAGLLDHALSSRDAYESGVRAERERIARDIHDNIGVQLMGALHSTEPGRKNQMIRETLTDLRDIINNAAGPDLSLDNLFADLRSQIADTLHAAGVQLDWLTEGDSAVQMPIALAQSLRSILREAVRNALRHGQPGRIEIRVANQGGHLHVSIRDDGYGFDPGTIQPGNGLENMRGRAIGLGGQCDIASGPDGTAINVEIPLTQHREAT